MNIQMQFTKSQFDLYIKEYEPNFTFYLLSAPNYFGLTLGNFIQSIIEKKYKHFKHSELLSQECTNYFYNRIPGFYFKGFYYNCVCENFYFFLDESVTCLNQALPD